MTFQRMALKVLQYLAKKVKEEKERMETRFKSSD